MQRSRPTTILLVNDDRGAIETFARLLRFEGYQVRTASNAEAGLHEAEASRPDAIILDFRTPITDSLSFVRRLRARAGHRDTPVAIVCGDYPLDDNFTAEVRALGAELQFKPLWLQDLVGIAERLAGAAPRRSQEPLGFDEPLLDGLPLDSADERPARQNGSTA